MNQVISSSNNLDNNRKSVLVLKEFFPNYFNVIIYNINTCQFELYNVIPYFTQKYKNLKKNKPKTFNDFKKFIKREGMYMFWSRCEYEIIISDWPPSGKEKKIDVWEQINNNLDLITVILMYSIQKNNKKCLNYEDR